MDHHHEHYDERRNDEKLKIVCQIPSQLETVLRVLRVNVVDVEEISPPVLTAPFRKLIGLLVEEGSPSYLLPQCH